MAKDCNSSCSTADCKKIRRCACDCGVLKATDFQLWEGCVESCNGSNPPLNANDYLKNQVGGQVALTYYGILLDDFDLEDTAEYKANANANKFQDTAIIGLVVLIFLLLGYLILSNFGK